MPRCFLEVTAVVPFTDLGFDLRLMSNHALHIVRNRRSGVARCVFGLVDRATKTRDLVVSKLRVPAQSLPFRAQRSHRLCAFLLNVSRLRCPLRGESLLVALLF
ncbi:hypothetical protein X997_4690 [Burkholderia pseudomallei A79C]|nr:hypothetical protein X997_4690 [Burkholderia pseudomallei A79C]